MEEIFYDELANLIEWKDKIFYLGSVLSADGSFLEVVRRIEMASQAFREFIGVWKYVVINITNPLMHYGMYVFAKLLYVF